MAKKTVIQLFINRGKTQQIITFPLAKNFMLTTKNKEKPFIITRMDKCKTRFPIKTILKMAKVEITIQTDL